MVRLLGDTLHKLIFYQLCKIQQIYAGNVILFKIKVFSRNIKETTLARYFIKVTARPSLTRLRVISRIKSSLNIEIEDILERFSCDGVVLEIYWDLKFK